MSHADFWCRLWFKRQTLESEVERKSELLSKVQISLHGDLLDWGDDEDEEEEPPNIVEHTSVDSHKSTDATEDKETEDSSDVKCDIEASNDVFSSDGDLEVVNKTDLEVDAEKHSSSHIEDDHILVGTHTG